MTTPAPAALLGVFPHPDDESIAAALTLLQAARAGVATHVLTCTGGEAGDNLAGIDMSLPMDQQRQVEMAEAARLLRLTSHRWLGHRDSGMVDTPDNDHPDAFVNVPIDQAARAVAALIRHLRPQVVISDNDRGTYGHPDHVRAHEVTAAAVGLANDPDLVLRGDDVPAVNVGEPDDLDPDSRLDPWLVDFHVAHAIPLTGLQDLHSTLTQRGLPSPFDEEWLEVMATPDDAITTVVDVPDLMPQKRAAMLAHRSQVAEDSGFFNFPDDLFVRAMGTEHHAVVHSAVPLDDATRSQLATKLHPAWEV